MSDAAIERYEAWQNAEWDSPQYLGMDDFQFVQKRLEELEEIADALAVAATGEGQNTKRPGRPEIYKGKRMSDELNLEVIESVAFDGRTKSEALRGTIGALVAEVRRLRRVIEIGSDDMNTEAENAKRCDE